MAASGTMVRAGIVLAIGGLAGCVSAPPPAQVPYVAVPGPTKTEAQFRQEDTACRVAALQLPPGPGVTGPTQPAPGQPTGRLLPAQPQGTQAQATQAQAAQGPAGQSDTAAAPFYEPPGVSYLRCMAARNNLIEPLQSELQPVYAYYPAYPIYVGSYYGFGGYDPWLYGAGFYGFYGGRFGGWRGGYGGYGYRGFRGGYHGGGFHGGGGIHGGGFRGGGFHR